MTMTNPMFAPLSGAASPGKRKSAADGEWVPQLPVPSDAVPAPSGHPTRGKPWAIWTYRDASGRMLGQVWRFSDGDGGKIFQPLTFCRHSDTGKVEWRWKGFVDPRPLYGLDRLALHPTAPER